MTSTSWVSRACLLGLLLLNLFQTGYCQNWVWNGKEESKVVEPVKTGFSQFLVRKEKPVFSALISGPQTGLAEGRTNAKAGNSNVEIGGSKQNSASFSSIFGVSSQSKRKVR